MATHHDTPHRMSCGMISIAEKARHTRLDHTDQVAWGDSRVLVTGERVMFAHVNTITIKVSGYP